MKTLRLHIHEGASRATLVFSRFPVLVGRDPRATWVHNGSRRLPVGVFVDLDSVSSEFSLGDLRIRAELCEGVVESGPHYSAEAP